MALASVALIQCDELIGLTCQRLASSAISKAQLAEKGKGMSQKSNDNNVRQ